MSLKIYHNPRCKKSRAGLAFLERKTTDFETVQYINQGLTEEQLREILLKLNKKPSEIVRTQEEIYKKELKGRSFTDDEWIKIIIENPKLLQRPIVVSKHKAVLGQPPEEIDKIL
jgi:arsenate reductase (glutaredoxin)